MLDWEEIEKKTAYKKSDWEEIEKKTAYKQPKTYQVLPRANTFPKPTATPINPSTFRNAPALAKITPEQQAKNQALAVEELSGNQGNIASFARGAALATLDPFGIRKLTPQGSNVAQEQASAKNMYNIPVIKNPRAVSQGLKPVETGNIKGTYEGLGEFAGSMVGVDPVGIGLTKGVQKGIQIANKTKIPVLMNGKTVFVDAATQGVSKNVSAPLPRALPRVSAEKTEIMSELERLAYESNVRKGKVTPQNDTLYGNSFRPTIGELPSPNKINPVINTKARPLKDGAFTNKTDFYAKVNDEYDRTIESVADYISNYKPKGVDVGVMPKNGDELMRDGGIRYAMSKNDLWYQDYYKKNGRAPSKAESKKIAENLVDESLRYGNGEFYNDGLDALIKEAEGMEAQGLTGINKKELPRVMQKPFINNRANKETPFTMTRNELPRANKVQPQLLPKATESTVQPILPRKGAEMQTEIKTPEISQKTKPITKALKKLENYYHGTNQTFNQFDLSKLGESTGNSGLYGKGVYLSKNPLVARSFGDKMLTTNVSLKNPFKITKNTSLEKIAELANTKVIKTGSYDDNIAEMISKNPETFTENLKKMGHDGVDLDNGSETVVFNPNNITIRQIQKTPSVDKSFDLAQNSNPLFKGKAKSLSNAKNTTVQPILPRKGAEIPTAIKTPEISQKPIGKVEQKFKDLGADTNRFEEVAMVTTDSKQTQPSLLEKAVGITREAKRKFLDSGETVARIGKINNDKGLYNLYNNAKNAGRRAEYHIGEAQTDINGNEIGKSLKAIFDPIRKKGTNYYEDFQEYMYHLHNIDRMAQEKPVFGESITAEESKKVSDYLLSQHPEFAQEAAEVRNYLDNMMQYRVQGGLVSDEGAKALNEMYSNYVPTYRLNPSTKGLTYSGQVTDIKTGIKKAVGSSKDLLPLHEQISKQTMQAVKATHDNLFGLRLAQNINPKTQQYVQELKKIQDTIDIDAEDVPELKNAFKIFENGQAYQMKVESGLYEGIQELAGKSPNDLIKAANATNKGFKQLITSWSPMFVIRNPIRDVQDVLLYSKDLGAFIKAYPSAIKELATNGEVWKKYKALGGAGNSFFDYAKGYKDNPSWLRKNTLDRVEQLNMALEQLPRLTEFMATINKLGHEPNYDELMQAMYNAADITVNFGRDGTWGKTLNSTFVPFFNPAIQGTDKIVRRFTETKGVKDWTELVLKISAFGIAPSVLNEMLYLNDPEYQRINDREKDINFLFKIGDGEFVKIPKGRVLSMFGSAAQRGLRSASGQKDAYAGYIKTMGGQVAPISPTDSNILSPIAAVKANKSWYGGTIEPQRLTQKYPGESMQGKRFDESTTEIAKVLGGVLNYSPKKIDYLLDAYSGVIGDFAMPLSTPKAERNPFAKAFKIDSVTSNKIGQQFYDKKDEIVSLKNSSEQPQYEAMNKYMNKQNDMVSDLYEEIRSIENGLGTDKVKREKVREVRALINGIQQTALDTLPEIEKTTKQLSTRIADPDELYRETNKKVFGSKYALQVYDKDVYEKAVKSGINMDSFYDSYFAQKDQPTNLGKAMALIDKGQNTFAVFDISDSTVEAAQMLKQNNISAEEYESIKQSADINASGNISKAEAEDYLNNSNYSQPQRAAMLKALVPNLKDKNNPYY